MYLLRWYGFFKGKAPQKAIWAVRHWVLTNDVLIETSERCVYFSLILWFFHYTERDSFSPNVLTPLKCEGCYLTSHYKDDVFLGDS